MDYLGRPQTYLWNTKLNEFLKNKNPSKDGYTLIFLWPESMDTTPDLADGVS